VYRLPLKTRFSLVSCPGRGRWGGASRGALRPAHELRQRPPRRPRAPSW